MPYTPKKLRLNHGVEDILDDLVRQIQDEFDAIAEAFAETSELELRPIHKEPTKPRSGMIVHADGVSWNPGSGAGAYEYRGGAWVKL